MHYVRHDILQAYAEYSRDTNKAGGSLGFVGVVVVVVVVTAIV